MVGLGNTAFEDADAEAVMSLDIDTVCIEGVTEVSSTNIASMLLEGVVVGLASDDSNETSIDGCSEEEEREPSDDEGEGDMDRKAVSAAVEDEDTGEEEEVSNGS